MRKRGLIMLALIMLGVALTACASAPITLNDLPVFPDAVELTSGESQLAAPLAKSAANDAKVRQALNADGKAAQKIYRLPKGTAWDAVKKFYGEKLQATGWNSAGESGTLLERVSAPTDISLYSTAQFTRGNQSLVIAQATSPGYVELFVALMTN